MLKPTVKLTHSAIFNHPGNQVNHYTEQCWQHQITEAIAYALPKVKELELSNSFWPNMPSVDHLPPQKLHHFALSPILKNKDTLKGMYGVLKNIFGGNNGKCNFQEGQLGYKKDLFNNKELVLINRNQKTVGLLQLVQQECQLEIDPFKWLKWFLPVPRLFHWQINYMDMIHDIYGRSSGCVDLLDYSKLYFSAH